MKYRNLRIAWSAAWGIVCLLLIALWVRSYWVWDWKRTPVLTGSLLADSRNGKLRIAATRQQGIFWDWIATPITKDMPPEDIKRSLPFHVASGPDWYAVGVPHWFALMLAVGLSAASWLRWRFSLRALLIGITVATIVMGWMVYAFGK